MINPRSPLSREAARKSIHIQSALVPVAYALGVPRLVVVSLLGVMLAVAVVVEVARVQSPRVRGHFTRTFDPVLRAHEHVRVSGATWLIVAFLAAAVLLPKPVAIAAMWAVSVGDAAAALVGRWLGRIQVFGSLKTLEGSTACAVATFIGARWLAELSWGACVAAAIAAAIAEWPGEPLDDNVRIVAGVAGGILLWQLLFT